MKKTLLFASFFLAILFILLSIFFYVKDNEEDSMVKSFIELSYANQNLTSRADSVIIISNAIYNKTKNWIKKDRLDWYSQWEATGFFNMSTAVSLEYGCYGVEGRLGDGPCGTMSKTLLNALWKVDIPARKLQLFGKGGGHTMVEFYDMNEWKVISPSDSSFIWHRSDGSIATLNDIKSDTSIFNQVYHNWKNNWRYNFDKTTNIRWDKIPSFLASVIKFFIGEKSYNTAETPKLYEQPRKFLFIVFLFLSMIFTLITYMLKNSINKRNLNLKNKFRV